MKTQYHEAIDADEREIVSASASPNSVSASTSIVSAISAHTSMNTQAPTQTKRKSQTTHRNGKAYRANHDDGSNYTTTTTTKEDSPMGMAIEIVCHDASTQRHRRANMIDKLDSMMMQEESTHYRITDYMKKLASLHASEIEASASSSMSADVGDSSAIHSQSGSNSDSSSVAASSSSDSKPVDISCREKICEWCYRVVDYFGELDREIVYFAMTYLDRLMMVHPVDRPNYKLAATTALLLAIKVHRPRTVCLLQLVSELSSGAFGADEVLRMELYLLKSLEWRLNPATPANFVLRIMALNPFANQQIMEFDMDAVQNLAIFFVEMSVADYYYCTQKSSMVAVAAILNAMECLGMFERWWSEEDNYDCDYEEGYDEDESQCCDDHRDDYQRQPPCAVTSLKKFVALMFGTLGIDEDGLDVSVCRRRLWDLYKKSDEFANRKKMERYRRLKSIDGDSNANASSSSLHRRDVSAAAASPPRRKPIKISSPKTVA